MVCCTSRVPWRVDLEQCLQVAGGGPEGLVEALPTGPRVDLPRQRHFQDRFTRDVAAPTA